MKRWLFYVEADGRYHGTLMAWSREDARETIERKVGPTRGLVLRELGPGPGPKILMRIRRVGR